MADVTILCTQIVKLCIEILDADEGDQPLPNGDALHVDCSVPESLQVEIGTMINGDPAVVHTPLVRTATGPIITVTDDLGLTNFSYTVDIAYDNTATHLGVDLITPEVSGTQPMPPE